MRGAGRREGGGGMRDRNRDRKCLGNQGERRRGTGNRAAHMHGWAVFGRVLRKSFSVFGICTVFGNLFIFLFHSAFFFSFFKTSPGAKGTTGIWRWG